MRRVGLLVLGVLLMSAGLASAQDESRGEVSVGWRYHHALLSSVVDPIQLERPNDYPTGWYADVSLNVSPKFAIVGEAAGAYSKDEFSSATGVISIQESVDIKFHTFMGGVRVRAPQHAAFVPFGQVLFGGERDESTGERTITVFQNTSTNRQEASSSNPVLALDAGITAAAGAIGVRASSGYVRFFGEADSDAFRFSLGGVLRF